MEVVRGEPGDRRQPGEAERLLEMLLAVQQDGEQALLVLLLVSARAGLNTSRTLQAGWLALSTFLRSSGADSRSKRELKCTAGTLLVGPTVGGGGRLGGRPDCAASGCRDRTAAVKKVRRRPRPLPGDRGPDFPKQQWSRGGDQGDHQEDGRRPDRCRSDGPSRGVTRVHLG